MGCTLYVPGEKGHVAMDVRCMYLVTRLCSHGMYAVCTWRKGYM